jgi:hypothetical protein
LINYQPTRSLENIINDVAAEFRQELKIEAEKAVTAKR